MPNVPVNTMTEVQRLHWKNRKIHLKRESMSCHHCFYLMWVTKRFPQHLLNVSHDGYLLMGSQGIFYPLGGRCTLVKQKKRGGKSRK